MKANDYMERVLENFHPLPEYDISTEEYARLCLLAQKGGTNVFKAIRMAFNYGYIKGFDDCNYNELEPLKEKMEAGNR